DEEETIMKTATIRFSILSALMSLCLSAPTFAADETSADAPAPPAPRHADGRINFGPPEGEAGYWTRVTANLVINPLSYESLRTQRAPIHIDEVPIKPWARELTLHRQE